MSEERFKCPIIPPNITPEAEVQYRKRLRGMALLIAVSMAVGVGSILLDERNEPHTPPVASSK